MKNMWQPGQGDVEATKANMRDIIQHHESTNEGEMAVGEIWHDVAADRHKMKRAAGVHLIASDVDLQALKTRVDVETDANGKSIKRVLVQQASPPATDADEIALYCKEVNGVPEFFVRAENSGVEIQITENGKLAAPASTEPRFLAEQADDPSVPVDQGVHYAKDDGSGNTEAFFKSNAGVVQLTRGGQVAVSQGDIAMVAQHLLG